MSYIIDRRLNGRHKSMVNRQRFLDRYKAQIRESVTEAAGKRSITDMERGESVSLPTRDISEPVFHHGSGGSRDMVEATSSGAQTIVTEGAALIGQFVPQLSIIEAPYIWKDAAHMSRALTSPIMEDFNKQLVEKRSLRIIGVNDLPTIVKTALTS